MCLRVSDVEHFGRAGLVEGWGQQPHLKGPQLSPEQLGMIEKLVAAQQLCNRRSFSAGRPS